jgi:hypothetical protein
LLRPLLLKQFFILPGKTLSQNEWDHMHWAERYRLRNEWFTLTRYVCGDRPVKQAQKCSVTFVRVAKRVIDPLNVPSALKPVLDALVTFGHLRGDTFNDVIVTTDQRKAIKGEDEQLEVTIETIEV